MKAIPYVGQRAYDRNLEAKPDVLDRCVVCGRPAAGGLYVRTAYGSDALRHDEADPGSAADSGLQPIGSECAKKLGRDYVVAFATDTLEETRS